MKGGFFWQSKKEPVQKLDPLDVPYSTEHVQNTSWSGELFNLFTRNKQNDLNDPNLKDANYLTLPQAQTELRAFNLDFNSTNLVEYIEKYNSLVAKVSAMLHGHVRVLFKKQITDITDSICRIVGDDAFAQIFYANTYPLIYAIIQYFFCFSQLPIELMVTPIAKSANQEFQQLCRYIVFRYRELYQYNSSSAFYAFCTYVEDFNKRVTKRINELCFLIFNQDQPEAKKLGQSLNHGGVLNNSSISILEYKRIDDMFQWMIRQKKTFDYVMIEFTDNVERLGTIPQKDLVTTAREFVKGEQSFSAYIDVILKKANEIRDYFSQRGFYSLGQLDKEQYMRYFLIIFFKNRGFLIQLRELVAKERKEKNQDFGGAKLMIEIDELSKVVKYYASQLGQEGTPSYQAFYQFLQLSYGIDVAKLEDIKLTCDPLHAVAARKEDTGVKGVNSVRHNDQSNTVKKGGWIEEDNDDEIEDYDLGPGVDEIDTRGDDVDEYFGGGRRGKNLKIQQFLNQKINIDVLAQNAFNDQTENTIRQMMKIHQRSRQSSRPRPKKGGGYQSLEEKDEEAARALDIVLSNLPHYGQKALNNLNAVESELEKIGKTFTTIAGGIVYSVATDPSLDKYNDMIPKEKRKKLAETFHGDYEECMRAEERTTNEKKGGSMQVAKEAAKAAALITGITSLSGAMATGAALPTALLGSTATAATSAILAAYMTKGDNVVSRAIESVIDNISLENQIESLLHEPTSEYWNVLRPCEESEQYRALQKIIREMTAFFKTEHIDLLIRVFQKVQFTFLTFLVEDYSLSKLSIFQNSVTLGDDVQQINQLSVLFLSLSRSADRVNQGVVFSAEKELQKRNEEVLRMQVKNVNPQLGNLGSNKHGGNSTRIQKVTPTTQYLQNLIDLQDFYQFAFDTITMNGDNIKFFGQDKISVAQALNEHKQRKTIGLFIRIFQSQNPQMINECLLEYNNAHYYYNILQKYLHAETLATIAQQPHFRHSDVIFSLFTVMMDSNKILSMTMLANILGDYVQIDTLMRQLCDELNDFVVEQEEWKKTQKEKQDQQRKLQLLSDPSLEQAYHVLQKFITISKQYKGFDDKVKAYYDQKYDPAFIQQMNNDVYKGKSKFEFIQQQLR